MALCLYGPAWLRYEGRPSHGIAGERPFGSEDVVRYIEIE